MRANRVRHGVGLQLASAAMVLVCGVWSLTGRAQMPPLRLVSTVWPPFTNEPGQARFALDLVEAALRRIDRTTTTTLVKPAQFTASVLSNSFDGSPAVWKDAERERTLVFSQPYLENRLVLIGAAGADVSAQTMADLKGKRVALVAGYSYGEATENSGAVFVRAATEEDSLALLLKRAVDYTLMDDLVVQYIIRNHPQESAARLQIGPTLVRRELYLAIRRSHQDAESIIAGFNAQLRGMISDRTYHRLLHVDWIRADINGDSVAEFVPSNDLPGPSEPRHAYTLFSPPVPSIDVGKPTSDANAKPGFYVGGSIYRDWASVPENYKVSNSRPPDASRSTASIFNFKW